MATNFSEAECSEQARTDRLYGLCDDQDGTKAYSDTAHPDNWIATVINEQQISVVFTAIDNCVPILNEGGTQASRCDGMLTYRDTIYLVELKDQGKGWIPRAVGQLRATIGIFVQTPESANYRYRKAFACNKRHPHFQSIDNEDNKKLFRECGFRLDIQAEIIIR